MCFVHLSLNDTDHCEKDSELQNTDQLETQKVF